MFKKICQLWKRRKMKESDYTTYYQHPKLDMLFGFFGKTIPTKQDKFKPLNAIALDEDGNETILKNLYEKKNDTNTVLEFNTAMKKMITGKFGSGQLIKKPNEIEVVLSISCNKRRFHDVDVDNLAKAVLDSLNGLIYEDDSQITSLISKKHINPDGLNGILIGIVELSDKKKGFGGDITLFSNAPWD